MSAFAIVSEALTAPGWFLRDLARNV